MLVETAGLRLASLAACAPLAKNPSRAARIFGVSRIEPRVLAESSAKKTATPKGDCLFGGDCWTRTSDLLRVKQATIARC